MIIHPAFQEEMQSNTPSRCRSALSWLSLLLCASILCGCAGYKLGPTGELRNRSVKVNPVINSTLEPALGTAVSHALRKRLQQDGTLRLETKEGGDILVNTEIISYTRRGIAFQKNDTLTSEDYELTMIVKVVVIEGGTGRELVNKNVRGRTTLRVGSDLVSAESQALPNLADNLARNITDLIVDGDW